MPTLIADLFCIALAGALGKVSWVVYPEEVVFNHFPATRKNLDPGLD